MWKVGGLKIMTAASRRIILTGWHRNWWKSAFLYKTVRTRKFSTWTFLGGSTHGILTGNYSFKKLSNYKKLFKKIFIKQIWKSFIQQNYSFVWKIDYRPGLSKTPVIRFSSHFTFSSTGKPDHRSFADTASLPIRKRSQISNETLYITEIFKSPLFSGIMIFMIYI